MGPQLYRCGNKITGGRPMNLTVRFNGAATLSLRKSGRKRSRIPIPRPLQWGRNFIVAEIDLAVIDILDLVDASMGPQLYRCGNPRPTKGQMLRVYRFNGAATLSLRKYQWPDLQPDSWRWLQWGRNFIVAEISALISSIVCIFFASMGPQLYRCGNKLIKEEKDTKTMASMGPQLYRCGNISHNC